MNFRCAARTFLLIPAALHAAPPLAVEDAFTSAEDTAIVRTAANGLRANDTPGTAAEPAAGLVTSAGTRNHNAVAGRRVYVRAGGEFLRT